MINGILNIYKEPGFTSHDVVAKLRGILGQKKIGHTGTLDPDAEGVLPVCLGRATKVVELLTDEKKTYEAVLLLGVTTDTQDASGAVLATRAVEVEEKQLREVIDSFLGEQTQIPPMYSAIKKDGKKLYELARQGVEVPRAPRPVCFYEIELLSFESPRASIRVTCSKGTYIRTLCHDIGEKLSCGACMEHLKRTRVGRFSADDAVRLGEVQAAADEGRVGELITPVDALFAELPAVRLAPSQDASARNGNRLRLSCDAPRARVYDSRDAFLGVYRRAGAEYKVEKLLPSPLRILTIGKFDGLHRGHQKLIRRVRELAKQGGDRTASAVLAIAFPEERKGLLTSAERRARVAAMRVDCFEELLFTETIRQMSPEDFVQKILLEQLHTTGAVVGSDFRFGKDRAGTAGTLRSLGERFGFSVEILEKEKDGDRDISSTYIREELALGHMEKVNELLGYPFAIRGSIVRGQHLGQSLGFPTINLIPDPEKLLPPNGVYRSSVRIEANTYRSLTNIGTKPTVGGKTIGAETYLLDGGGDFYGKTAEVELLGFLRPEKKFDSVEELVEQIRRDVADAS